MHIVAYFFSSWLFLTVLEGAVSVASVAKTIDPLEFLEAVDITKQVCLDSIRILFPRDSM